MTSRERIRELLKKINPTADIDALEDDMVLDDQGIDSLDRMSLFLEMEEAFSIKIPEEDVDQLTTITALANYVDAK